MKCNNCGYDNTENSRFCSACGSVLVFNHFSLYDSMFRLFNDNIFMILCILHSISIAFSLISGSIPIIRILMTVFLWQIFAQIKKGILTPNYMRYISGTIYAFYIINWVLCGIMAFCGLLLAVLSFTVDTTKLWNMFYSEIGSYINSYLDSLSFITSFYMLFISAALILVAIISACLNVFGRRSIHHFAQALYKNLEYGQINLTGRSAAQTWMMVFGILKAISAMLALSGGNMASFLEDGCLSAVFIMGNILVNKYLSHLK